MTETRCGDDTSTSSDTYRTVTAAAHGNTGRRDKIVRGGARAPRLPVDFSGRGVRTPAPAIVIIIIHGIGSTVVVGGSAIYPRDRARRPTDRHRLALRQYGTIRRVHSPVHTSVATRTPSAHARSAHTSRPNPCHRHSSRTLYTAASIPSSANGSARPRDIL